MDPWTALVIIVACVCLSAVLFLPAAMVTGLLVDRITEKRRKE